MTHPDRDGVSDLSVALEKSESLEHGSRGRIEEVGGLNSGGRARRK